MVFLSILYYSRYRNGTDNDLLYWGLDYPPLTAFHEYILGTIAQFLYPEMVSLGKSHGLESTSCVVIFLSLFLSSFSCGCL